MPNTPSNGAEKTPSDKRPPRRKGLVVVNTGMGKGKSTAAFGIMFRAWGRGMKVCAVQFIKNDKSMYGEQMAAEKLGIEMIPSGRGFTWTSKDLAEDASRARNGWRIAKEIMAAGEHDVVVLDEITYPMRYGWIEVDEVVETLKARPPMVHVVLTGRHAPVEIIEAADLVTEMQQVKHPYHDQNIRAQRGIEF